MSSIPTIRLDDTNQDKIVASMRSACCDVGFFYLQGHGIDTAFLQKVMKESQGLFELPLVDKEALADKAMSRGYTAMQEEKLDPAVQTMGDTKEGFYIGTDISKEDPRYNPAKLVGPNQWPDSNALLEFQSTMEAYFDQASAVAFRVVRLIALALKLPETYFDQYFQEPMAALRLLHYAKEESRPEKGIFACGAHSDYGMVTLLLTDENHGLQILTSEGKWMDVPPQPTQFVVNLGDMLERWTNGLVKSTKHRVLTCGDSERYSIPFFYEPAFDTVVQCLDVCCSETNPPKYPPTTAGEHLLNKYHETHADFSPEEQQDPTTKNNRTENER
jgi:isopenicillin N synthase-like dioxygenase